MYKLAIFDFDGTLVDSAPGIVDVMRDVVIEYNLGNELLDQWSLLIGVPLLRQAEILFPDRSPEFHDELANRYRAIYDTKIIEICPLFPGLMDMLNSLHDNGVIMSIASSKRRHLIDTVLEYYDLAKYFQMVVGASDVTHHKPHPESVLNTARDLNISLAHSVVIGDSSFDLDMARNAEVDAIGVTTGIHTRELLEKSQPRHIVGSLEEVTPLILNGRAH